VPADSRRVLITVSVAVVMASLDLFIVNIAFPDVARDFPDTSLAGLSWILNAYAIVFAALLVPAGRIADRIGRRRTFLAGLVLFVAASAACAVAPSVPALVAARVVQAAGAAALMPTSLALLLAAFPPAKRSMAIGIWAAMGGVAAAAGPPLGGLLVQGSWRLVFLINIPVGIAAVLYGARVLPESRDEDATRWPDLLGTAVLAAAVALVALGLVKAPDWGWGDARSLGSFALAAAGLALFVARCARHDAPVVELPMLRVRSFALACAAALLFFAAFGALLLGNVLFLTQQWHYSVLVAGLALAPGPAMAATFAAPAGRLADRIGQRRLGALGCLVFAAGCSWWLWRATPDPNYAGRILPGMLVTGIGVGLTLPSLASAAVVGLPAGRLATGSAVYNVARQVGTVLGVAILIAIFGHPSTAEVFDHFRDGYLFMAIASAGAAVAALAIGPLALPVALERLGLQEAGR
jgi:EmrB/QacA subfamily drug resistance transporter